MQCEYNPYIKNINDTTANNITVVAAVINLFFANQSIIFSKTQLLNGYNLTLT